MTKSFQEILEELTEWLDKIDPERKLELRDPRLYEELSARSLEARRAYARSVAGDELLVAREWIKLFTAELQRASTVLGVKGWLFSKEFKSFLEDPEIHLAKKLFIYFHDLLRRHLSLEEFEAKARAAVNTSLRTNMRSLYQNWCFTVILEELSENHHGRLVYPEHGYLSFERSGKQRTGTIPPNAVLRIDRGELSFYLEAPRPVSWADSYDLKRVWKLYTTLRPDLMIYGGRVLNILELASEPPIKKPNIIVEFKELEDWYTRVRDLRGPFAKKLSAEEWRSRWFRGLWEGLADVLGVRKEELAESKQLPSSALRVKEPRIIMLYKKVYSPDTMILICRARTPEDVVSELESSGIKVYDGVGFDRKALEPVAQDIARYARRAGGAVITAEDIRAATGIQECSDEALVAAALEILRRHRDEVLEIAGKEKSGAKDA